MNLKKIGVLMTAAALAAALAAFAVTALLVNIFHRQEEARNPFMRVVQVTDETVDPAEWGKNFPMQYDQYRKTADMERTRHGGSEALPHNPTAADPRTVVTQSKIELDPRLKRMWAGYAFAIDFREERGHAYMLDDQTYTERHKKPQFGNCIHCHGSVYVPYKKLGNGDLMEGFAKMCAMPYAEARTLVEHPVACIDCHDPDTMQLRVTRPGFLEGIKAKMKAERGIDDYDPNTMATRQEMRSFVCGQCHVEYHFRTEDKRLVYPWFNGLKADQELAYYDETGFKDWTHEVTGAPMLKTQHPEFEMWSEGTHARAGVACADCHMPYMRVGGLKISDHHVRSPLLNINNSCQTCHKAPEAELLARAERIQDKTAEMKDKALGALMELIDALSAAKERGVAEGALEAARLAQRRATFLIDFVEAENSTGFHAPQEAARVLFTAMDHLRQGQMALTQPADAVPAPAPEAAPAVEAVPAPAALIRPGPKTGGLTAAG
ncbi:MAG: ammonia-forming cytochrome c nitrite reductase subunit c552 [Candidatus Hydrogenedentes bacterium]|nr:ammonia-forming cytochrome c nitrite reductase subunit c552 [Candidatus Hydrogenedentota bacterium]